MRGARTTKPAGGALARRDRFTLVGGGPRFDRGVHGELELDRALDELFRAAAPDLGVSDPSDGAVDDETGEVAGVAAAAWYGGGEAVVGVAVLPSHRGRGCGRGLVERAVEEARRSGQAEVVVHGVGRLRALGFVGEGVSMTLRLRGPAAEAE